MALNEPEDGAGGVVPLLDQVRMRTLLTDIRLASELLKKATASRLKTRMMICTVTLRPRSTEGSIVGSLLFDSLPASCLVHDYFDCIT